MEIGPQCKLENRNTKTSWKPKIISCGNFVVSSKLSDLELIWGSSEPVSRCMVHDSWVSVTISFYLTVTENGTKKLLTFVVSNKGKISA